VSDGILIDLRPLLEHAPVEVISVSAGETRLAGMVDQLPDDRASDEAANRAISHAEKQNWFIKEREEFFPLYYYWDSPNETQEYLEAEWSNSVTVDEEVWRNVRSMWAVASADARVRIQLRMLIAGWKKG
jgi:hypothetical protein